MNDFLKNIVFLLPIALGVSACELYQCPCEKDHILDEAGGSGSDKSVKQKHKPSEEADSAFQKNCPQFASHKKSGQKSSQSTRELTCPCNWDDDEDDDDDDDNGSGQKSQSHACKFDPMPVTENMSHTEKLNRTNR